MKAAFIMKGKLVFLEGSPEEIVECLDAVTSRELSISFLQPPDEPASWEKLRDFIKGTIEK